MEEEKKYIVAVRCKNAPFPTIGAIKRKCLKCGEEVWIGKALQGEKVDGEVCDVCIKDFEFSDMRFVIKPEVVEEFMENMIGRNRRYGM